MSQGVYLSIPFCRTKCSYCNFASRVFARSMASRYVDRLCEDIAQAERTAAQAGGILDGKVDSIFFGGGTPTSIENTQFKRIFHSLRSQFELTVDAEITVECAPGSLRPEMPEVLAGCGVTRVSLGVQSFIDHEAAAVGRLHTRAVVRQDIARLRGAGIANINLDLIAGLPHQTVESWRKSVDETIATGVPHVSVYMLEIDEQSRLGRELIAGGVRYHAHFVPNEDLTADLYLEACGRLAEAGIVQYEISNFALPGKESQHNLKYWTRQPYVAFGLDAHSMLYADPYLLVDKTAGNAKESAPCLLAGIDADAVRFATTDSLERYIAGAPLELTIVSNHAALEETFFLGLRLNRGVNLKDVAAKFGVAVWNFFSDALAELQGAGLIERQGDVVRLTARGRLLSNEVFSRFISSEKPCSPQLAV